MNKNILEVFALQKFNLYIYKDIADLIYYYSDSSTHADYMDHLICELDSCISTFRNYHYRNLKYITMTLIEKQRMKFPTNITAPEYDEHNSIVSRIRGDFNKIKYYKYRINEGYLCYEQWRNRNILFPLPISFDEYTEYNELLER